MDDGSLLVPANERWEDDELAEEAETIHKNFLKLGIVQLVLGILLLANGIIIAATWPDWGVDSAGEGIWCGVLVIICGTMAITARFHLYTSIVIINLISDTLTAVVLSAGIITASWSTVSHLNHWVGETAKFIPMNALTIACMVVCVYLAIVFGKVLNQKKEIYCCPGNYRPMGYPEYAMVYVPPGSQGNAVGAYVAAPGNHTANQQEPPKM